MRADRRRRLHRCVARDGERTQRPLVVETCRRSGHTQGVQQPRLNRFHDERTPACLIQNRASAHLQHRRSWGLSERRIKHHLRRRILRAVILTRVPPRPKQMRHFIRNAQWHRAQLRSKQSQDFQRRDVMKVVLVEEGFESVGRCVHQQILLVRPRSLRIVGRMPKGDPPVANVVSSQSSRDQIMRRSPPMRTYNLAHANDGASYPLGGMACQPLSPTRKMNTKSASSRSAKRRAAKPISTTAKSCSKTDWARLSDASAAAMPTDEHPDVAVRCVARGVLRRGLQSVAFEAVVSLRVD